MRKKNNTKKILVLLPVILWLAVGGAAGIADGDTDDEGSLPPFISSNGESGIDLSGFPARATLDAQGGTVEFPDGPSLDVPADGLTEPIEVAFRPSPSPPALNGMGYEKYTVLTEWFDLAAGHTMGADSKKDVLLSVPVKPPAIAKSHPGLQILISTGQGILPLAGSYNRHTGKFEAKLIGIPGMATFAVAFNPDIRSYSNSYLHDYDGGFPRETINACRGKSWGDPCDIGKEGIWMCVCHTNRYVVCDRVDKDTDGE